MALTPWPSLPATWGREPIGDVGDLSDDRESHPVFARATVANKTGRARRRTGIMTPSPISGCLEPDETSTYSTLLKLGFFPQVRGATGTL